MEHNFVSSRGKSNFIYQDLATIMANCLQELFDLGHEPWESVSAQSSLVMDRELLTDVKDRHSKLDVSKMPWTLGHILVACGAFE